MKQFNLKKLNQSGIAHLIAPLLVVLAVGAAGTYLLVGSHADSNKGRKYGPATTTGKERPKLKVISTAISGDNYSVVVELVGRSGKSLTATGDYCHGSLLTGISRSKLTISDGVQVGATWDGICKFVVTKSGVNQLKNKKGSYTIVLSYSGSVDFYSAQKTVTVKAAQ